jgi:hypothetical protein
LAEPASCDAPVLRPVTSDGEAPVPESYPGSAIFVRRID